MEPKQKNVLKKIFHHAAFWIVCAVLLIAVCVSVLLHFSTILQNEVTEDLSMQFAREINAHMAAGIDSTIDSFSNECRAIDYALTQHEDLTLEEIYAYVERMCGTGVLSYMGFLDSDGYLYDGEGYSLGMTRISIVSTLLNGAESVVSDNETIHSSSYIMYGMQLEVPLQVEGRTIFAIIIGMTNDDMARQLLLHSDYSNTYADIIQQDGYYIVKNDHETAAGLNEYSILRGAYGVSEEKLTAARESIATEGFALLEASSTSTGDCYVCFTSVPDTSWILVSHIPREFVKKSVNSMRGSLNGISHSIILLIALVCAAALLSLKRSNDRLRESRRQLDEALVASNNANVAKTRFLNNMSHDIRTPMNAIIGMLNIIRHQTRDAQVLESVGKLDVSANYLLSLINDVLDISRIESGKMKLAPQPVVLDHISADVAEIIRNHLTNRTLDFVVKQEGEVPGLVMADTLRIQEILLNILNNAVKFTADGGRISFLTEVLPGAAADQVRVRYTIADTGMGMSEEFVKTIFEEFVQENRDARTQYKGTGLGMSIVKKLVDMMNGTIEVQSKKGEGSTFIVTLPMAVTERPAEVETKQEEAGVSVQGLNVLLAEDNDLNAEIAEFMLESNEITMVRACNGREAVELFAGSPAGTFDLILMDVMMPEMDGYEATRAIRKMADRPDAGEIPIIAMTANAFVEDVQEAKDAGLNAHLSKPVNEDELMRCIAKYVGIARREKA